MYLHAYAFLTLDYYSKLKDAKKEERVKKAPAGAFLHQYLKKLKHQPNFITNFNGKTFITVPSGIQGHFGT